MVRLKYAVLLILAGLGLAACRPAPTAVPTQTPPSIPTSIPVVIPTTLPPTAAIPPSPTPIPAYGPTGFPANINPLTGLEVSDPNVLNRRPILIKVSNESEVVRPQSGLSFADQVWEYQMEGFAQTRFTAIIYSQSPERVGSVRSARLIDVEHLVDMYGGILVFSGGSSNLADPPGSPPRIRELVLRAPWADRAISEQYGDGPPLLVRIPDIPRPGVASWHTLFAVPSEIWNKANAEGFNQRPVLDGFRFDYTVPAGGTPTTEVVIDYPSYGPKHTWRYDTASGRWLSWTDDQPDGDTLAPGQQLAFDNVVIVYAEHYEADFLEDDNAKLYSVGANLMGEGQAVLLRDGQRFEVIWRRSNPNSLIQFFDAAGNVIAFKPGTTWFNVASSNIFPPAITFTP